MPCCSIVKILDIRQWAFVEVKWVQFATITGGYERGLFIIAVKIISVVTKANNALATIYTGFGHPGTVPVILVGSGNPIWSHGRGMVRMG